MRAWRLSKTLFSCPEYVWMKYHCFMQLSLYSSQPADQPIETLQHVNPDVVPGKKVDGEEDHTDNHDDGGLLHLIPRRKRRFVEFATSLFDELADPVLVLLL